MRGFLVMSMIFILASGVGYAEQNPGGDHSIIWNAKNVPSGVYFYRIITSDSKVTGKISLLK